MVSLRRLANHTITSYSTYIRVYLECLSSFLHKAPKDVFWQEMRDFIRWLDKQSAPNGSRLTRAFTYARIQWNYMMTYLEDGHCSISNNMSENAIRFVTVGRKNWLFCDSTDGVDASMMAYSLLETAKQIARIPSPPEISGIPS